MLPPFKEFMLLPKEMQATFSELKISSHLRQANIKKSKGFSCLYLFTLIFLLTINVQNYFQLISSYKIPMQKEKTLTQILV
jgi:hypothetical protein